MKQFIRFIFIACTLFLLLTPMRAQQQRVMTCGEWVTFRATAYEGYQFESWSDGNTEPERRVQVNENATYIAYFSRKCEEYANWPVVALYDWLMMLNVKYINDSLGYYFGPEQVTWYQVVGEPDDLSNPDTWNDIPVINGSYYLTLGQNLTGTGDYYALIDVSSNSSGHLCSGYMCSELIRYSSSSMSTGDNGMNAPSRAPKLMPSVAKTGEVIRLTNLEVNELTDITIYDPNGRRVSMMQTEGEHTVVIDTDFMPGCYLVKVDSPSGHFSLKFILSR